MDIIKKPGGLSHIAIWTKDLERSKAFYTRYFNGTANNKYVNSAKGFASYFITFGCGPQLELMFKTGIEEGKNDPGKEYIGLAHIAFSFGSREKVNEMTELFRTEGCIILGEPRQTGDGFYESVIADPDGNRIEITE